MRLQNLLYYYYINHASMTPSTENELELFQRVSLTQWWNGINTTTNTTTTTTTTTATTKQEQTDFQQPPQQQQKSSIALPLIDLRSENETLCRISIPSNDSSLSSPPLVIVLTLPWETLLTGERSCELPPRNMEFAILISYSQNYTQIYDFFMATKSKVTGQSRQPWKVRQVIIDQNDPPNTCTSSLSSSSSSSSLQQEAILLGLMTTNTSTHCPSAHNHNNKQYFQPLPRLWNPDPLVQNHILKHLKHHISVLQNQSQLQSLSIQVWDLGCGSGRDVCFLAEQIKCFIQQQQQQQPKNKQLITTNNTKLNDIVFIGMDCHKGSAKRCLPLWKHRGVHDMTKSHLIHLNKMEQVESILSSYSHQQTTPNNNNINININSNSNSNNINININSNLLLIYAIRFLNRKLIQYLLDSSHIPVGTIFATSHFCKQYDDSPWNFDHPKEKHVLERSELRTMFEQNDNWKILLDDICFDGDHGRTLIQFMTQRI